MGHLSAVGHATSVPARKPLSVWPSNPAVALWSTMVGKKVVMAVNERTLNMVAAMGREVFGTCSNHGECESVCPKGIPLEFIADMNRDLIRAAFRRRREPLHVEGAPLDPAHEGA